VSDVVSDHPPAGAPPEAPVIARLSFLDRFLPLWILVAMAVGIGLGRAIPSLNTHLNAIQVTSGTSLPIFIGLLVMMYPVLAKVRYDQLGSVTRDRRMLVSSLVLNWVVGPAVMFALAWLYFYLEVLPRWLGLSTVGLHLSVWRIAETVAIFLGVPLLAGYLTRTLGERARGRDWYETKLLPRLSPFALYGLLYTIVILFALQGHTITSRPADVARIALPLLGYFAIMWFGSFALGRAIGLPYERTATLAFTAAGNNFELAIAVAIGVFGVTSGEALAGVVGPLIEVPVLVALVYVSIWARGRFYPRPAPSALGPAAPEAAR
jgi:ACR3 family arsenite transporter